MNATVPRALPVGGIDGEYALLSSTLDQDCLDKLIDEAILLLREAGRGIAFKELASLSPPALMLAANAGVVLRDCHVLEIATPEATSAMRIVASLSGLERLCQESLQAAIRRLRLDPAAVQFIRGVTDFSGYYWGHHVSIGAWHIHPLEVAPMLEAALVTLIYAGAGFMTGPTGWAFRQKAPAIKTRVSLDAREHPLMDAKHQTLAGKPWTRTQISSTDAPRSDRTLVMKISVLSLLIHAFENGAICGYAHALDDPVDALHQMDGDPSFTTPLRLACGLSATPLEIQRHYQQFAASYAERVGLPWLIHTARAWGDDLARLESGADRLAREHDAFIKWQYLDRLLARVPRVRDIWPRVCRIMDGLPPDVRARADLRGDEGFFRELLRAVAFEVLFDGLRRADIAWREFPAIARLWRTVRALDISYHSLNASESLYDRLVREGEIEPPLISDADIHEALENPPPDTRAKARAEAVRRVMTDSDAFATWDSVVGVGEKFEFADPLGSDLAVVGADADSEDTPF